MEEQKTKSKAQDPTKEDKTPEDKGEQKSQNENQTPEQTTPEFRKPEGFSYESLISRMLIYPGVSSNIALTTQSVNSKLIKQGVKYDGWMLDLQLRGYFRYIVHRYREGGPLSVFRGLLPYLIASYEQDLVKWAQIQLQKRWLMPIDPRKLKKSQEIPNDSTPQNQTATAVGESQKPDNLKNEQSQAKKTQGQHDPKQADQSEKSERKNEQDRAITLPRLFRFFFYDFGTRALGNLIFWPFRVLKVSHLADLGPEHEFEEYTRLVISILEKEGWKGFYRGIKFRLLATLITSIARTAEWGSKAEWFCLKNFTTTFNLLVLRLLTSPLIGFARMRVISDQKVSLLDLEARAKEIIANDIQVLIMASFVLHQKSESIPWLVDYGNRKNMSQVSFNLGQLFSSGMKIFSDKDGGSEKPTPESNNQPKK